MCVRNVKVFSFFLKLGVGVIFFIGTTFTTISTLLLTYASTKDTLLCGVFSVREANYVCEEPCLILPCEACVRVSLISG